MCPNRITKYCRKPKYSNIQDEFQLEQQDEEDSASDSANDDNDYENNYDDPVCVAMAKEDIAYYGHPLIEHCSDDTVVLDLLREKIRGKLAEFFN